MRYASLLLLCLVCHPVSAQEYTDLRPLLVAELQDYRIDCPDDLYKFVFQSVMGPGHAIPDPETARRWMEREWQELETNPPAGNRCGRAVTPLRGDGAVVRIHLQASLDGLRATVEDSVFAVAENALRRRILDAFVETARIWKSDRSHLISIWEKICADEALWSGYFSSDACSTFTLELRESGWPAVHHSESYKRKWAPHYRVVAGDLWRAAGGGQP